MIKYQVKFSELREWSIRANRADRFAWTVVSAGDDGVLVIEMTGSLEAYEAAMDRARELVRSGHLEQDLCEQDIVDADAALRCVLTGTDRFWMRWSAWRDGQLALSPGART